MSISISEPSPGDLTPYAPQTWVDVPAGTQPPIGAVREDATAFNRIEQGLASASRVALAAYDEGPTVYVQTTPSGRWNIPVQYGRPPAVSLYISGRLEYTDVECPPPFTTASLVFPVPMAGVAVLT